MQCHSVGWKAQGTAGNALRASFGPHGTAEIPLSPVLADIQRETLAEPGGPPAGADHGGGDGCSRDRSEE